MRERVQVQNQTRAALSKLERITNHSIDPAWRIELGDDDSWLQRLNAAWAIAEHSWVTRHGSRHKDITQSCAIPP